MDDILSTDTTVVVIGAGGKMGMRVSDNLVRSAATVRYCEISPAGRARVEAAGRQLTDAGHAVPTADVVILAVPDIALRDVSAELVPAMRAGAIVFTLDPAAAYAQLLHRRDDITYAVAHPCHPSVFLHRRTEAEMADTFGGIAALQDVVVAAVDPVDDSHPALAEAVARTMYAPVDEVHHITVEQMAYLEPTLVEVVACMVGDLLNEALQETVHKVGVPEPAARAMLLGHIQVALANGVRGDNPFSDACLIAMEYGRRRVIRDDWKSIFDRRELDDVVHRMLRLDTGPARPQPAPGSAPPAGPSQNGQPC